MRRWRPARIANTVSVSATRTERPLSTRRPQPLPPSKRPPPGAPCLRIWTATIRCRPERWSPVSRATTTPPRRLPRPPKPSPKRASRTPRKTLRKSAPTSGTLSRRNATGKARGKGGIAAAMHVDGTDVPWEEPKRYNLFMALYQTILRVMFNAPRFFAALPATNGKLTRPRSCSTSSSACSRPSSSACGTS